MDRPVFLLASAWRSGSTLLQRVLSSGPELFVWGESHGAVERLRLLRDGLARHRGIFAASARAHAARGLDAFIANLNPDPDRVALACRAWFEAYYAEPTRAKARRRWGFKEVRCDAGHARFLLDLFPEGRVILLVRDPVSVLASLRSVGWYRDAPAAGEHWRRATESFLDFTDPRALLVRYERLIADPGAELERICAHLDLRVELLDRTHFGRKVRAASGPPTLELPQLIELHRPALREVAMRAGYDDPASDPRLVWSSALRATAVRELETASRRVGRLGQWLRARARRISR